jgi:peptide/nickel transport system substrate-binding protein
MVFSPEAFRLISNRRYSMKRRLLLIVALVSMFVGALSAADAIKRGGVIKVTPSKQGVLVKNFNPFSSACLESTYGAVYEALIYFNQANASANPWLAEKWAWSKDLKSITFILRQGVKFNDGSPLTADDVVYSVMLGKDNKALDLSGLWVEGLDTVSASGNTIVFTFKDVNVTALEKFGSLFVVPKAIWSKVADPLNWTGNDNPVATGPFMLDAASFGEQSYKLVRNPGYWQKGADGKSLPYIDGIQYVSTTNDQIGFKLISGEYDWACYLMSNLDEYTAASPDNKYWFGEGNLVYLYMNNAKAPFDNANVRKAIAMGVSQKDVTRKMVPSPVPATMSAIKASFSALAKDAMAKYNLTRDVAKAKKTLEAEGYKQNAKGIYEKDGKALSFKVIVPTDWTDWVGAAETVASQLKDIGVELIVSQEAWPDPFQLNLNMGTTDMAINTTATGTTPYYQLNRWLHSSKFAPLGTNSNAYYAMHYKNDGIDKNLAAYRAEPDPAVQKQYLSAILEQFMKDTPCVPLFFNPNWFEYNTKRFVGWPSAENPYAWPSTAGMQKAPILLAVHLK